MSLRERGVLSAANPYTIGELNKGAKHYGFTGWFDPRLVDRKDAQNILNQLSKFEGIWRTPLTTAEVNRLTKTKHTWASVTKEFPDFKKAFETYMDTKTQRTDLKKINELDISAKEKFNMMSGTQKQFIVRYNRKRFQPFKNTITTPEIAKLSNFKDMSSVLGPVNKNSFNYKNGIPLLDIKFNKAHRAIAFQDYLKKEGIEKVEVSSEGAEGEWFKRRYKLTPAALKAGKDFKSILKAYPKQKTNPSEIYNEILAKATRNNPIYLETQGGLRSVFKFVKNSINSDLENYKPKFLRSMVEKNPAMLRHATAYVDPTSRTIKYQGLAGLKNLSDTDLLDRLWINTEHNRPMRDYASKFMEADRITIKPHMLKYIDVDMAHNISPAPFWYNNSLKETATRLAEANPDDTRLLNHLDKEFKLLKQRFYVGDKFYGAQIDSSPSYGKSIMNAWRNNYKGMGLEKSFDKYVGEYNLKGQSIGDILNGVKKDPKAIKQLGQFFRCTTFDEGGRVNLAVGGQGVAQCVETKLKQPGAMEKVAQLPEEVGGALGKIKNVAKGFLGALGKFGPAAGKYGAIAAAGAIAQPLIKQFMNDDPSTYLTDENQQAGMLEALIEGERPKPRSEALDLAHTAGTVGATAAAVPGTGAMYKARRGYETKIPKAGPISEAGLTAGDYIKRSGKGYGKLRAGAGVGLKLLSGMFTPAGLMATEPLRIAQKRREGESWGDIGTDPTMWMGPAFAPSMTRLATRGMNPSSFLPKLLRLGMSRAALAAMGPVGWAGLAASLGWEGYSQYKDYKKGRGFFASDEE